MKFTALDVAVTKRSTSSVRAALRAVRAGVHATRHGDWFSRWEILVIKH